MTRQKNFFLCSFFLPPPHFSSLFNLSTLSLFLSFSFLTSREDSAAASQERWDYFPCLLFFLEILSFYLSLVSFFHRLPSLVISSSHSTLPLSSLSLSLSHVRGSFSQPAKNYRFTVVYFSLPCISLFSCTRLPLPSLSCKCIPAFFVAALLMLLSFFLSHERRGEKREREDKEERREMLYLRVREKYLRI